jgi:hypothetical protein
MTMTYPRQSAIDEARDQARELAAEVREGSLSKDYAPDWCYEMNLSQAANAALLRAIAQGIRESEHYITRTANRARAVELEAMAKEIER